jgi:hypothetical protein
MFKKLLAVFAGSIFGALATLGAVELREGHPDTYVVQKGDTLWDIAGRFLDKPWLWPEIWQANPQIENPHLIYPGDVLSLVYDAEGRARLMRGTRKLSPQIRSEPLAAAVRPVPLSDVEAFLKRFRMLDSETWNQQPYVVALEENRLLSAEGQLIYVRQLPEDTPLGTEFAVVRPTAVYREIPTSYPWHSAPRKRVRDDWDGTERFTVSSGLYWVFKNRPYHETVEILGHEAVEIGVARLARTGDPASLVLMSASDAVKPGDLLLPLEDAPFDFTYYPHAPERVPANMRIFGLTDAVTFVGPKQVVAINRGARDGVANGQVYGAYTAGPTVRDDVRYARNDLRTVLRPSRAMVELPPDFTGNVMIFRTYDRVSYGLVMDGIRPVKLYDELRAPH